MHILVCAPARRFDVLCRQQLLQFLECSATDLHGACCNATLRRHCPELADQLCFPDKGTAAAAPAAAAPAAAPASLALPAPGGAGGADAPAAAATAEPSGRKGAKEKPFTALDGLWQLLKGVGQLLKEKPQQVAAALRVLCALWETQETATAAVEALREQTGFWDALKVCDGSSLKRVVVSASSPGALVRVEGGVSGRGEEEGQGAKSIIQADGCKGRALGILRCCVVCSTQIHMVRCACRVSLITKRYSC